MSELDVVIVGAGVSGLALARTLIGSGLSVRVLEARDRVGGRLMSVPVSDDAGLDLGATWFWANEDRVQRLNAELGLAIHDQSIVGDAMYENSANQTGGPERLSGNPLDTPAGRWTRGAQTLTEALAATLPADTISLDDPVTAIEFANDGRVNITSASDVHNASHVVLAVPPSLAIDRIDFAPELPPQLVELARTTPVWMGAMAKIVAHYDQAFWLERGLSGSAFSHDGPMRELHDMSGPDGNPAAIFGFAPAGRDVITPESVLSQLGSLFGADAATPTKLIIQDWSTEEWTSPSDVLLHTNYQTYGHPAYARPACDGRLHWASTETSPIAPGHVEGALVAAQRTATAIVQERNPESVTDDIADQHT